MNIDTPGALRLLLLFVHLLLCVFALQAVLSNDWRLLFSRMQAHRLLKAHGHLTWMLLGLWTSGLGLVALDTGLVGTEITARPKLIAKLACVSVLTANSLMLRLWCFPRILGGRHLGFGEAFALMAFGAVSTASWLMAAFFGIAQPLQDWTIAANLNLYGAVLVMALVAAILMTGHFRKKMLQGRFSAGMQH